MSISAWASAASTTSITVHWEDTYGGASTYTVLCSKDGSSIAESNSIPSNVTQTTISNLSPGTIYSFTVTSLDADLNLITFSGAPIECSTLASAPTNVTSHYVNSSDEAIVDGENSASSTKMIVSFTPPSGDGVVSYAVSNNVNSMVVEYFASSILITGLTKSIEYQFYVKAVTHNSYNVGQLSAASAPSAPRTAAAAPDNMGVITLSQVDNTSVSFGWGEVDGNGLTTNYKIARTTDNMEWADVGDQIGIFFMDQFLNPGTQFTYRVTPYTAAGTGTSSTITAQTTGSDDPVPDPVLNTATATDNKDGTIDLSWDIQHINSDCVIQITYTHGESTLSETITDTSISKYTVPAANLTPGVSYTFTIKLIVLSVEIGQLDISETPHAPPSATSVDANTNDFGDIHCFITDINKGGYETVSVSYSLNGTAQQSVSTAETSKNFLISNATLGVSNTIVVTLTNDAGSASYTAYATPYSMPGAPTGVTATAYDSSMSLTCTNPVVIGSTGISKYRVRVYTDAAGNTELTDKRVESTTLPVSVTGLTDGVNYYFSMAVMNNYLMMQEFGPESDITAAARTLEAATPPGTPVVTVTPGHLSLTVAWASPSLGSNTSLTYTITYSDGTTSQSILNASSPRIITGLVAGTAYNITVTAIGNQYGSTTSSVVTGTPITYVPAVPANFRTIEVTYNSTTFVWDSVSSIYSIIKYEILFSSDGNNWQSLSNNISTAQKMLSISHIPLVYLSVRAFVTINGIKYSSDYSNVIITYYGSITPPVAPVVTVTPGYLSLTVAWTTPSLLNNTSFLYTISYSNGTTPQSIVNASSPTTINDLVAGTTYTVTVTATGDIIGYTESAPVSAMPYSTIVLPTPEAPTVSLASDGILVTFNAVSGATEYTIQRDISSSFISPTSVSSGNFESMNGYVDSGVSVGTTYYYRVIANNDSSVQSTPSPASAPIVFPAPPGAPVVTVTPGHLSLTLSWPQPYLGSNTSLTYNIAYSDGTSTQTITNATSPTTINSLVAGTSYNVTVTAVGNSYGSTTSSIVTGTPFTYVPAAPANFVRTGKTSSSISVMWGSVTSPYGSINYNLSRSTDGANWSTVIPSTILRSITISGLSPNTIYYFRVRALVNVNSIYYFSESYLTETTGTTPPGAPVVAVTPLLGSIRVEWPQPSLGSNTTLTYSISYSDGTTTQTIANATSPAFINVQDGTIYNVTVTATGNLVGSTASTPVLGKSAAPPEAPATPLLIAANTSYVDICWNAPISDVPITRYELGQSTDGGWNWITVNNNISPSAISSYRVSGLSPVTQYKFRVMAVNAASQSSLLSNILTVTTSSLNPSFLPGPASVAVGEPTVGSYNGINYILSNTNIVDKSNLNELISKLDGGSTFPAQITIPDTATGTPTTYNALVTDVTTLPYNSSTSNAQIKQVMRDLTPSGTNISKVVIQSQTASGNKSAVATVAVVGGGVNPTVTVSDPTATTPSRAAITTSSLPSGARVMFGLRDDSVSGNLGFIIKAFNATDNLITLSTSPIPILIHKPRAQVVEGSGYKASLYFSHYDPTSSVEEGITLTRAPASDYGTGESLMVAYSGTINVNQDFEQAPVPAAPSDPTAICFLGDAPILTPRGYRRADSLRVGDKVRTADGRSVAVQRVFTKTYQPSATVNPYVIPTGQFGAMEDVMVSPEHRVVVPGTGLVEARKLGLKQHKMTSEFTYYNLELPNWQTDNLVIGGVEAESLAPVRRLEITKGEFLTILKAKYGKLTPDVIARACRTCFMTASGKVNIPVFSPSAKK